MTYEMTLREREEDAREEGMEKGIEKGMEAMVLENLEDGKTQAQIESRLMRHFDLDAKRAHEIFCKYSQTSSYDDIK